MADGIQIKVCGLTSLVDADCAHAVGADYLGFIVYPKSPRFLSLDRYRAMSQGLPGVPKVAVSVQPTPDELQEMKDVGFDFFQVHFRHDLPLAEIEGWSGIVGARQLWLAPKLPPAVDVSAAWLPFAGAVLLDTFDPTLFGGTGRPGDWVKVRRHRELVAGKDLILSGGLNAENIGEALRETGTGFVDVNSGVESAPGVKDRAKLTAFFAAARRGGAAR
jgi:phosphoribosylanthranilate isomerase